MATKKTKQAQNSTTGKRIIGDNIKVSKELPEKIEDIRFFRLFFTSTELFVLKFFIDEMRPINIQEIYSFAMFLLFHSVFGSKQERRKYQKRKGYLLSCLINASYGRSAISEKEAEKVMDKVYTVNKEGASDTELTSMYYEELKKHKSKVPSYDKLKKIIKTFEEKGIIMRIKSKKRTKLYTLTPQFYKMIKDKKEDILEL